MVNLTGFHYEQSTASYLVQGIKNNRIPRGSIGGGNGTFVMAGEPPKVIFYINNDGANLKNNFYSIIKYNSSRKVTEKYCRQIFDNVKKRPYNSMKDLENALIANCE